MKINLVNGIPIFVYIPHPAGTKVCLLSLMSRLEIQTEWWPGGQDAVRFVIQMQIAEQCTACTVIPFLFPSLLSQDKSECK